MVKKLLNKVADALVPKEIAPFLGTAGTLIAPFAPGLGLTLGQLGSAKMYGGKLDPAQALAVGLSYYGGGGPQRRAEGKLFGQRLGEGIGSFMDPSEMYGKPGQRFIEGFKRGSGPVTKTGPFDRILGTTGTTTEGKKYQESLDKYNQEKANLDQQFANKDITKSEYDDLLKTASEDIVDERGIMVKAGDFFKKGTETIMPGFTSINPETGLSEFNFGKALTTVGTATTLSTLGMAAEELKRAKMRDKQEEGKIYTEWFNSYKRVSGRDYAQSPFPDPVLMEKYREFMMAQGGRVGYNMGGGIMDAAPGVPPGMELDYRESGGFIPMGSQEKKDDVPAVLAKNEFVLTSDAMTGLDKMMGGSGDPRAAAKYMYQMMDQLEAMA
jgi:hypothetical protein